MTTIAPTDNPVQRKQLRVWPGLVIVALQWLIRFGLPALVPGALVAAAFGGLFGGLAVIIWWAFFSRAARSERWGAILLMLAGLFAASRVLHESVRTGMMGMMFIIYSIPVLSLAFVAWAVATRRLNDRLRRISMVATILLACGAWGLVRTNGITGDLGADFAFRWTKTREERLLAQSGEKLPVPSVPTVAKTGAVWPGFRGPERNGIVLGARIGTNWSATPPSELWRRDVGPAWSSFAVSGDLSYTQEQRGDDEVVTCYRTSTGAPVWVHRDKTRFWESNAGAGPRATPTLSSGRLYTFGATGILNALEAADGDVAWSHNAASDTGVKIPGWGFAGSPLVVGDLVIVATAGTLAAYERATGDRRWVGTSRHGGYSSPQLATLHGVQQVLLLSGAGAISVAPADGKQLWEHNWRGDGVVQPAVTADGDVLIGTGSGLGTGAGTGVRRIAVVNESGGWTTRERWTSPGLKPYFNDFVVHAGHAFGFGDDMLACIDLKDGHRKWKGGRYGHGQLVLLPEQALLLVLSEKGTLALVTASTEQFVELARFQAIQGKTWNHPVLAGDILLVRNAQEMAAFRLAAP